MSFLFKQVFKLILNILYPKRCLGCGVFKTYLCDNCLAKIPFSEIQVCFICNRLSINGTTHFFCQGKNTLDSLLVMSSYDGLLKKVIKAYKYRQVWELANPLSEKLFSFLQDKIPQHDVLTFVPLSLFRKNSRGFNQAELLAQKIGLKTGKVVEDALEKTAETKPQAALSGNRRKRNLAHVFSCRKSLTNQRIILIDDVATTGTTLNECAKALKKAGASKVYGVVLARGH